MMISLLVQLLLRNGHHRRRLGRIGWRLRRSLCLAHGAHWCLRPWKHVFQGIFKTRNAFFYILNTFITTRSLILILEVCITVLVTLAQSFMSTFRSECEWNSCSQKSWNIYSRILKLLHCKPQGILIDTWVIVPWVSEGKSSSGYPCKILHHPSKPKNDRDVLKNRQQLWWRRKQFCRYTMTLFLFCII